jgi:hypothetical protein
MSSDVFGFSVSSASNASGRTPNSSIGRQQNYIVDALRHIVLPFGMEAGYSPPPWPLIWINRLTSREENMPATFVISWERKMSVAVQYVVRPNPGTDPAKITELAKEGAVLWRKHGGKVTYWTVAVGEVGNRVLSITFENFAAYGAAVDKMGEDKEVRAWQAKRMKAGYTTWVRSNMATEIEI